MCIFGFVSKFAVCRVEIHGSRGAPLNDYNVDLQKSAIFSSSHASVALRGILQKISMVRPKRITFKKLYQIIIICRGSPAGSIGYYIHKKTRLPFYVESFEPHADYMLESGVWSWYNPKYIFAAYWEQKQKKYAEGLMPVARNYREKLLMAGVDASRVDVIPCCVSLEEFKYMEEHRLAVRKKLNVR